MSGTVRITYTPRPDATPEGERAALAAVYKLILDCHQTKKNAAGETSANGDDGTKIKGDSAYGRSIP